MTEALQPAVAPTADDDRIAFRPAGHGDIARVWELLSQAIDTSPYYNDAFKAQEKRRLDETMLHRLVLIDPWHVALACDGAVPVGVIVTMPEFGTLWSPWVYIDPAYRTRALGLSMIRFMIRHWDNGRFHKIACHVRPDNRAARLVFQRVGFAEVATLPNHAFGEDILLLERPLTKAEPGYDHGLALSRGQRFRLAMMRLRKRLIG